MKDKRYLFRGFHPDENGKTIITLDGEKIRGEWVYWNVYGILQRAPIDGHYTVSNGLRIIPETVGQWVTTDKNGKDVFEGDILEEMYSKYGMRGANGIPPYLGEGSQKEIVIFDRYAFLFKPLDNESNVSGLPLDIINFTKTKVVGNKWEVME